ncbi:MAG: hypothetical protein DHS20C15_32560 [Planctomycetota bacterium]|nr:MAG: hypothetical protein DHS20C15_32560 [Planctomycetota bacterium]
MGELPLHAEHYRALVSVGFFLAAVHAWRKLSPYFAACWFGSGLVFGWFWNQGDALPETVLLPALLVYQAAAVTKGLVETRDRVRGNHLFHVLLTGLLTGVLALPWEAAARAMSWELPRRATRDLWGLPPDALGGVGLDATLLWVLLGTAFYGVYKLLDHTGLPRWLQTLAIFGVMPWLPRLVGAAHAAL